MRCFMKDCKKPLWAKNPLFAIEYGHYICRECIYEVFVSIKDEGNKKLMRIECQECKAINYVDFLTLEKNFHLQSEFHKIS